MSTYHYEQLAHFHLLLVWGGALAATGKPSPLHHSQHDDGVAPAGVCVQVCECHLPAEPHAFSWRSSQALHLQRNVQAKAVKAEKHSLCM